MLAWNFFKPLCQETPLKELEAWFRQACAQAVGTMPTPVAEDRVTARGARNGRKSIPGILVGTIFDP